LECPDCTHLRNGITKATCASKKTFEKSTAEIDRLMQAKRNLEEKLDHHYTAVNGNHENYATTIHKAIVNKYFDISMNVDAAGTIVMNHGVYYMESHYYTIAQRLKTHVYMSMDSEILFISLILNMKSKAKILQLR